MPHRFSRGLIVVAGLMVTTLGRNAEANPTVHADQPNTGPFVVLLPVNLASADRIPHVAPNPTRLAPTITPTDQPPEPTPEPTPGLTYWRDVMPVLAQECTACHYTGGIGPMPLTSYEDAKSSAFSILRVMEERLMPPFPPDPSAALPLDDPRIMSDQDRATLMSWVEAGAPEGDPATAPQIPPPTDYGPPSDVTDIGVEYMPSMDSMDDYRCFVVDPHFLQDTELSMVDLEPTNNAMFHHGILYLATPDLIGDAEARDRAEPGPGYTCFGGPGINSDEWVAAEAVGSPAKPFPNNTAKVIPAGSRFVLQIHYNTMNGMGVDRTKVRMWRTEAPVGRAPRDLRMANFTFLIPAGAPSYTATVSTDIRPNGFPNKPGPIWQVWGHMHMLGARFSLDLIRANGASQRLLHIPHWDFHWQGVYNLATPIRAEAGDRLLMTCVWDNSPENQPVVGGVRQNPRLVHWGEGSLDEMCLGGVTFTD